jgi:hypothetical protein
MSEEIKKLYIGDTEVTSIMDIPDNEKDVNVELSDGNKIVIRKKLCDLIVKNVPGNGKITDCVYAYIAEKFVKDLAEFGLERYQIEGVAANMGNLVHNWTENKIGEFFKCKNSGHIRLEDIV